MKRLLFFIIVGMLSTGVFIYLMFIYTNEASKAAIGDVIDSNSLTADSTVEKQGAVTYVNLYTKDAPTTKKTGQSLTGDSTDSLFNTSTKNDAAILEFIKKSPKVPETIVNKDEDKDKNVKGLFFSNQSLNYEKILPPNFEGDLVRRADDRSDTYLSRFVQLDNYAVHHYYNQKINGIPVYAAVLAVHAVDNQIYGVTGNLVTSTTIEEKKIDAEQAKQIAYNQAQKEAAEGSVLQFGNSQEFVFNKKAIGISEDSTNYITLGVNIHTTEDVHLFDKDYFVDLKTGQIVFSESHIYDALNRTIYDCGAGCGIARRENDPPKNDTQIDGAYDYAKDTYDYYLNNHQRDSYNGAGGGLNIVVRSTQSCPNAFWGNGRANFCNGMVTKDVVGHELTHGVTESTAHLTYANQSGALNESFSDIFGSTINGSWSIGVGTIMGEIRRMDDPTNPRPANPAYKRAQPDKLYSSYYYCGSGDSGGVHINSGILNKAYYLMADGGSFNNCTIAGQGREKTMPIAYRALTRYLTSSSNIKAAYTAFNTACQEIYPNDTAVCDEVKKALQATEMDLQADGSQSGPMCATTRPAEPAATCAGQAPAATLTPTTPAGATPTPTGTSSSLPAPTNVKEVKNATQTNAININVGTAGDGVQAYQVQRRVKDTGDYSDWEDFGIFPVGQAISDTIDPTKTYQYQLRSCSNTQCTGSTSGYVQTEEVVYQNLPTQGPNPTLAEGGDTSIMFKLKFQGITSRPSQIPDTYPVKITLSSETGKKYDGLVNFTVTDGGVWTGTLQLNGFESGRYKVFIKGPQHIQKKVCDPTPTESSPGTYRCRAQSWLTINKGSSTQDFSGIIMLTGDLPIPDQDGVVNALDISYIRNNIGNPNEEEVRKCDVNLDGVCDTQDYSLVIAALAVRYDEE